MPKITDEMWKCPKCGVGEETRDKLGLVGDDYTTYEEAVAEYGADELCPKDEYGYAYCGVCGWEGTSKQVYNAAQKRANRVKCPHCKGSGWVDAKKEDNANG